MASEGCFVRRTLQLVEKGLMPFPKHEESGALDFHNRTSGVIDRDIHHKAEGLKALGFADTSMIRCKRTKFKEFQPQARAVPLIQWPGAVSRFNGVNG